MKRLILSICLALAAGAQAKEVLLSFDGSKDLQLWADSLELVKTKGVKFTYFVSAPYFVTKSEERANPYWGPAEVGESPIKFREDYTVAEIQRRYEYLTEAVAAGCEIGSHLCGHYNGETFTAEQWRKEFEYFKWALSKNKAFDYSNIKGIRVPSLGRNAAYFKTVKDFGYLYDSSVVWAKRKNQPYADEIYLNQIAIIDGRPTDFRHSLAMDFNFNIFFQTHPGLDMEKVFFDSLVYDYEHSDRVSQVCLHFEKFDGQPYYKAMLRFIDWLADKNPTYLTYSEYFKRHNPKEEASAPSHRP